MKYIILIYITIGFITLSSCQKELTDEQTATTNYNLKLSFTHKVGTDDMQLGNLYQNAFNESYTLTDFKYYISNITLHQSGEVAVNVPGIYHLVDEAEVSSQSLMIPVSKNKFDRITFLIGVDSTRNVSGTQTGDLDPVKGMFWTWNSGYIMAKMEANSPQSTAPANKVEIHVGGFRSGENSLREVSLDLAQGSTINIKENGTSELILEADANKWFNAVHEMKIATFPVATSPGETVMKYADNYAKMFRVAAVNN